MKSWKGRKNRKVVGKVVKKAMRLKGRARKLATSAGIPVAPRAAAKVPRSSKSR